MIQIEFRTIDGTEIVEQRVNTELGLIKPHVESLLNSVICMSASDSSLACPGPVGRRCSCYKLYYLLLQVKIPDELRVFRHFHPFEVSDEIKSRIMNSMHPKVFHTSAPPSALDRVEFFARFRKLSVLETVVYEQRWRLIDSLLRGSGTGQVPNLCVILLKVLRIRRAPAEKISELWDYLRVDSRGLREMLDPAGERMERLVTHGMILSSPWIASEWNQIIESGLREIR